MKFRKIKLNTWLLLLCICVLRGDADGQPVDSGEEISKEVSSLDPELILLDSIVAVKISPLGMTPIFSSDAWFANPLMGIKTIEQCLVDTIWLSYANEHGIKQANDGAFKEYAEEYFDAIVEQKKISKKEIEKMLEQYGFTLFDIRKFLNNQYLIQQTVQTYFAATGKLHVSDEEIMTYYACIDHEENDLIELQIGTMRSESDRYDLQDIIEKEALITWQDPYTLKKKSLKKSLSTCQVTNFPAIVHIEYDVKNRVYTVYKFLSQTKMQKSIDSSYDEINKKIMTKYQEAYQEMTKNLLMDEMLIYSDISLQSKALSFLYH